MVATTDRTRVRRAAVHGWWVDGLEIALWLVAAAGVAFAIAAGALITVSGVDYLYSAGRLAGIVAAVLVLNQILLISRAPWVERAFGHDRAAAIHTRMGKVAFILMCVHVGLITIMTARYDGRSVLAQTTAFWELGWFMPAAQAAFGLFAIVVGTSLLIVRRRWRYESWHTVHLIVYVAIALVVPHQFLEGSTFRPKGAAWWFWLALYVVAIGSWLMYRVIRPLWVSRRHGLTVAQVTPHDDGTTSVVITGRALDRLRARPGQFFLWRFLAPGMWRESHPYSLSSAPTPNALRITVRPSGDHSSRVATLVAGTRVIAEGPLGVFTDGARATDGVVLVAAGIGITPVRAMLEAHTDGPCTVIVRARGLEDAPLLDEVRALAAGRADVIELLGARGTGWSTAARPVTLAELVPDVAGRDVFICGPVPWADAVEADARAAGVPPAAIHRERFGWS